MTAWNAMLHALLGEPLPPLPELPGRVIVAHDEPMTAADLAAAAADGCGPAEFALLANCSRPTATQRLRALRKTTATERTEP